MKKTLTRVVLLGCSLLTACSSSSTAPTPVSIATPQASEGHFVMASDPEQCLSNVECSLKTARTLLFVYDYAALGAPLMQRTGSQILSPTNLKQRDWPVVRIQLPEDGAQHFQFRSACLARQCRYSAEELHNIYRRYLAGEPCVLPGDPRRNCELSP